MEASLKLNTKNNVCPRRSLRHNGLPLLIRIIKKPFWLRPILRTLERIMLCLSIPSFRDLRDALTTDGITDDSAG
jgi:hypothetical protein